MKKLTLFFAAALVCSQSYAHKVIGILDGDTLELLVNRRPVRIRLANIDAPEKAQPFGQRSKQSLSEMCWEKEATYQPQMVDKYGRTVALVYCGGVEVNRAQVERGMAWVYQEYNKDSTLPAVQERAKVRRTGLWSDNSPLPPWQYRHRGNNAVGAAESECHVGPRGGHYRLVNGRKRYDC